jgi:2-phosphoglycolate phosphatase
MSLLLNKTLEMHKVFLFDMDGTLVDTFDLIYESFNKALEEHGKTKMTKRDFDKKLFGKPVDSTISRLLGITTKEEHKKILKSFERYWLENLPKVKVFKNVPQTLKSLKQSGYVLGVVSTSPRDVIAETLKQTGVLDYFDVLIGEEDAKNKKPHHEPIVNALSILRAGADKAVFIGDTIYDVQAGKAAGCRTIFMLNPYNGEVLEQVKPDRVIKDISELLENGQEEKGN